MRNIYLLIGLIKYFYNYQYTGQNKSYCFYSNNNHNNNNNINNNINNNYYYYCYKIVIIC